LEEVSTNVDGEARVPKELVNFPHFEVSLKKAKPCSPRTVFNMGRVRNDGQNAPNRCGTISPVEQPGLLTIFSNQGVVGATGVAAAQAPSQEADWTSLSVTYAARSAERSLHFPNEIEALLARGQEVCKPRARVLFVSEPNTLEQGHENGVAGANEPGDTPSGSDEPPTSVTASGTEESPDSYLNMRLP
jgi:GMP synthase-like glutamine amidotransferase